MGCEMDHSHLLFPICRATPRCYTAVGWRSRLEPEPGRDGTSNSAVLRSSQRELSNAHEITFPDAREAKALWTPLGAVG
eukprot:scaffold12267_cov120-Isochrysis_galbana.AAC.3